MSFIHSLFILLIAHLFIFEKIAVTPISTSEKKLEVQILFPDRDKRLEPNPCLNVNVLIINHTDTVASFFEDWNSWGYFNIYFQIKTTDTTYVIYKKDRDWPKNFPSFKALFPGDSMSLIYSLDYGYCTGSQFSGTIPRTANHLSNIKAVYQLKKEALEDADLEGYIKYKYKSINKNTGYLGIRYKRDKKDWIIIDSLKNPVEANRTFPLTKLESKEYELR